VVDIRAILAAGLLLSVLGTGNSALAEKPGGTLKVYQRDSRPACPSARRRTAPKIVAFFEALR
jgi:hypothetical protein